MTSAPATVTNPALRDALAASHLASLPAATLDRVLADATLLRAPVGSTLRREGDPGAHVELVIRGLIRIYVAAPDGRTLTIRYARPGALMGAVSLFRRGYVLPGSIGAVVDSEVLALRATVLQQLAQTDLDVSHALNVELAERVAGFTGGIPGSVFATVRQRVASHLLDLAADRRQGPELIAPISQQELAAAVGTVREVVVRVLRELRDEGLVTTSRSGILLLAPERLLGETFGASGTWVPPGANAGR
jgi:CRP/FNR family cyclic AMP-dependent transcriptional regulator